MIKPSCLSKLLFVFFCVKKFTLFGRILWLVFISCSRFNTLDAFRFSLCVVDDLWGGGQHHPESLETSRKNHFSDERERESGAEQVVLSHNTHTKSVVVVVVLIAPTGTTLFVFFFPIFHTRNNSEWIELSLFNVLNWDSNSKEEGVKMSC